MFVTDAGRSRRPRSAPRHAAHRHGSPLPGIPGTTAGRTALLTAAPEIIRLLRHHLKLSHIPSGSVFRSDPRYGHSALPLDDSPARRAGQRYCAAAGVTATIHQLRHSRASQLVQARAPLGTVRKVLGHRNRQSTLLYAEGDPATVKRNLREYQRRKARVR